MSGVVRNESDQAARQRRREIRALKEERELAQLKRAKVRESWGEPDHFADYLELITREREGWIPLGLSGLQGRRHGRNWPTYRTENELALLREPARALAASNSYAIGLIDAVTSYVIGTGYTYTAQVKGDHPGLAEALQRIVDEFLLRNQWGGNDSGEIRLADADRDSGEQPSMEEEACKRIIVDGELITCTFPNDDGTTDVRVIEPDQLTQPPAGVEYELAGRDCVTTGDFDTEGFGVLTPEDDAQNPVAYSITFGAGRDECEIIDAQRVTHIRGNAWRTSKRGMTDFSFDTLDTLKSANTLCGNLGEGAAQQAALAWVTQHATGSAEEIQSFNDSQGDHQRTRPGRGTTEWVRRIRRGEHIALGAGDQFVQGPGANNATAHVVVLQALLRRAAVRWCGTEWLASGDSSNNNFASSLVANNHFVIAVKRRQKMIRSALGMIVARALRHFVRTVGFVQVDGKQYPAELVESVASINVTVPSPESADPLQQAQRYAIETQWGATDPITWAEKVGNDPDQIRRNRAKWKEDNPDAGTPLSVPPGFGGQQ